MNLTEKEQKKLKSLHVVLKMSVYVSDLHFKRLHSYYSNTSHGFPYDFSRKELPNRYMWFDYGVFKEVFISFKYSDVIITIGPFLTNPITHSRFLSLIQRPSFAHLSNTDKEKYWQYYSTRLIYSLGDIRDFITLLGDLFNLDLEQLYSDDLHEQVHMNELEIMNELLDNTDLNFLQAERYAFYYENQILKLVISGDLSRLKQGIADMGHSVVPKSSGNPVRAEKNYTIVILEKLSALAIHLGKDILDMIKLRDFYIRKVESKTKLADILVVRDSAIIHFTKELYGFADNKCSPMILSVLQYINLNIYDSFKISDLAQRFFISESALRRNFKNELGINITEYINKRKIALAKIFLGADIPISDIAHRLGFFDASHFHRVFKKFVGATPKQYQESEAARMKCYGLYIRN